MEANIITEGKNQHLVSYCDGHTEKYRAALRRCPCGKGMTVMTKKHQSHLGWWRAFYKAAGPNSSKLHRGREKRCSRLRGAKDLRAAILDCILEQTSGFNGKNGEINKIKNPRIVWYQCDFPDGDDPTAVL